MARVTYVKAARQRYEMVPVLDADGNPVRLPVLKKDGSPKKPLPNLTCGTCGIAEVEIP